MKCFIYRYPKRLIQSLSAFILLFSSFYAFAETVSCEYSLPDLENGLTEPIEKLTEQAEAGNIEAMLKLGYIYDNGINNENGVEVDFSTAKALYFYHKAAKRNNPVALLYLAEMYDLEAAFYSEEIQIYDLSWRKAELYYIKAAQAGCTDALYSLGMLNFNKLGIDKATLDKSVHYLELAANAQNLTASYQLFKMLNNQHLHVYDTAKANDILKNALSFTDNSPSDTLEIATQLFNNGEYAYALQVFNSEQFKNDGQSLYYQAYASYHGYSTSTDFPRAFEKFQQAAELNHPEATYFLGTIYKNGSNSVIQDYAVANSYFERAAKLGSLAAINELGQSYEAGLGVHEDLEAAYNYYYIAAMKNEPSALYNLVMLVSNKEFKHYNLIKADYYAVEVYRYTDIKIAKYMLDLFDNVLSEKDLTKDEIRVYSRLRQNWEDRLSEE